MEFGHPAAELELSSEFAETADKIFQDQPDPFVGSSEAFEKNASEHDAELTPVHIVLFGVAIPHQGTEDHLDQERIGEDLFEDLARRAIEVFLLQIVIVGQSRQEFGERVLLMGELFSHLVLKEFDVVVEAQFDSGKGDARASLRGQLKVIPSKPQLLKEPC